MNYMCAYVHTTDTISLPKHSNQHQKWRCADLGRKLNQIHMVLNILLTIQEVSPLQQRTKHFGHFIPSLPTFSSWWYVDSKLLEV